MARAEHPFYNINVRKVGKEHVLHNFNSIAGARLFHGEDDRDSRQRWPFRKTPQWVRWSDPKLAKEAADRLQEYLVARELSKAKKKR